MIRPIRPNRSLLAAALLLVTASLGRAEIKLASTYSDDMVLQRRAAITITGQVTKGGETVTVTIGDQKATATAKADGEFGVTLKPLEAGGPFTLTFTTPTEKRELKNVLVGDVWVCSGQSNMEFGLNRAEGSAEAIAAAGNPQLRLYTVPKTIAQSPQSTTKGSWSVCSPANVGGFTAVGYFFGAKLQKDLGVPIGLIHTSWGGTPAEAWTPREKLLAEPATKSMVENSDKMLAAYDPAKAKADHEKALEAWKDAAAKAKAAGKPEPRKPSLAEPKANPHQPSVLYNGMIHPLIGFPVTGAIWYQGESNVGRAAQYHVLFPTMIKSWRDAWGQPDMPFYFVQIAPYNYKGERSGEACAELWDAQLFTMKTVPHTGMAVITDVANLTNIHPTNKKPVGERLALWALAKDYGKADLVFSGPVYKDAKIDGDKIRLSFDHIGGGLVARDGKPLNEFTIAGADEKFVPATAAVDGETIVVHADSVTKPVAVRFGYREMAQPNLINKEGLPASPFRTDAFKMVTEGKN